MASLLWLRGWVFELKLEGVGRMSLYIAYQVHIIRHSAYLIYGCLGVVGRIYGVFGCRT